MPEMSLLPAAQRLAVERGQIPTFEHYGLRSVRPNFTTSHGFRWAFPGQYSEAPGPIVTDDGVVSSIVGNGLYAAHTWSAMGSNSIPANLILLLGWDAADELARDGNKSRVRRAFVIDLFSPRELLAQRKPEEPLDLHRANLQGADLHRSFLQGANLQLVDLQRANLQRVDLQRANLQGANLQRVDLQRANLQGANLHRSFLQGANLQGANLQGANLQRSFLQGANLQGANLQRANLQRVDLQGVDLQGVDLQGADLHRVDLQGANLQGANLQRANLHRSFLRGADLQGAKGLDVAP